MRGLDTSADTQTPDIQKPDASFESKLVYVLEHVKQKLGDEGGSTVMTKFFDDLKSTATLMAGIAAAAGVAIGGAALATGGAALPVAMGALASAASAVGVAALWATGFEGVKFLYDVISIGVSIYSTPHTDCASLKSSADALFDKITNLGSDVLGNVVGFGLAGVVRKLSDVFRLPNVHGRCSFEGDTLVLARDGYTPIRDIEAGRDQVWAKGERTGEAGWKGVLAQYSNTYEQTVHTRVRDKSGREHTLSSNRIHSFFARVAAGVLLTVAAEGHVYAGDIEGGAWVDAQHLQQGDELLDSTGAWQQVVDTEIEATPLEAYNLTVDGYSTYFVAGEESVGGVWVHNKCFAAGKVPDDFKPINTKTTYGQEQYISPNDELLYKGHDGKYYTKIDHPPTQGFVIGHSDGGPGLWKTEKLTKQADIDYQSRVTVAPPGQQYVVPYSGVPKGEVNFDSIDPATNTLIDAKNWKGDWPIMDKLFSVNEVRKQAQNQLNAAGTTGAKVEWRVKSQETADKINEIFRTSNPPITISIVVHP